MNANTQHGFLSLCLPFTALCSLSCVLAATGHAQTLDPSLKLEAGKTGSSSIATTTGLIPLPDGKALVFGSGIRYLSGSLSYTNLARVNSDGSIDSSFKFAMKSTLTGSVTASGLLCVEVLPDGQMLIGGQFMSIGGVTRSNIARLNCDGTLDSRFNAGAIDKSVQGLLAQPDGKILAWGLFTRVNGQSCNGLCRFNEDGGVDTNFNAQADNTVSALALQPDGKIIAIGSFTQIGGTSRQSFARLHPDGSLDEGFLPATFKLNNLTNLTGTGAIAVQPDGKILVANYFNSVNGVAKTNLARFHPDGSFDSEFVAQADFHACAGALAFSLQADGRILVAHDSATINGSPCPLFSRLLPDGNLDPAFSTNLVQGAMLPSCAMQADGRLLLSGSFTRLCGQLQSHAGRLFNTELATQQLDFDGTNVVWLRGGTSPEVWRTTFEASTNGIDWTFLGAGDRITGGWQLPNAAISQNATVRARGLICGGRYGGSSWYCEAVYPRTTPTLLTADGNLGFRNGQFGFSLGGSAGSTAVIERAGEDMNWSSISTNMLPAGPILFSDPASSNSPVQFYRARLQD